MSDLNPEQHAILEWHKLARVALPDAPAALEWIGQVQNLAWCWDHAVDGDPLDTAAFNEVMGQVLLEWPANPFYRQNLAALVPALAVCIDAWKRSDATQEERILAYAPATDLMVTVLFLVGGRQRVNEFGCRFRELARTICICNDTVERTE